MARKAHTVTINDLARHAKVSPATVSRVINSSGYVSTATRSRVEQAIAELGYRPDARARSLRGMPSGLVALLIPDILNVFYTSLSQIIEDRLRQAGYTMLLGITKDDSELYGNYLNQFWELKVDGIIFVPPPDAGALRIACRYVIYGEAGAREPFADAPDILDAFPGARLIDN